MATYFKLMLIVVALLTVSFGVIDSQAAKKRKHSHSVKMRYFTGTRALPPANDPRTSGVESASIRCPRRYRITGGSYDVDSISFVPTARIVSSRGYGIIAVNNVNQRATMRLTIACIRAKVTAKRALAGPSLESRVRRLREQRRASD